MYKDQFLETNNLLDGMSNIGDLTSVLQVHKLTIYDTAINGCNVI